MTLNPIKALTEQFQKLIDEHGSANIQAKHIVFLKDRLLFADREITKLITENTELKSKESEYVTEINKLRSEITDLKQSNEDFKNQIQTYENPHNISLDTEKVSILKLLFENEKLSADDIARSLDHKVQTIKFHLEELKTNQMVNSIPHTKNGKFAVSWYIQQDGRKYLIENNLRP